MRLHFQTADLDTVLRHYADGFKPDDGERIFNAEVVCDVHTRKVIYKLYILEKGETFSSFSNATESGLRH